MINTPSLADILLNDIGKLYAIETNAKPLTDEQRYYYQRRFAKPFLQKTYC